MTFSAARLFILEPLSQRCAPRVICTWISRYCTTVSTVCITVHNMDSTTQTVNGFNKLTKLILIQNIIYK